ncbi:MAG: hypothetical protein DWB56_15180 [Candidatus Jettenia sp.]|nr:hypothetical protein [Candidatus Jettenia sp.]
MVLGSCVTIEANDSSQLKEQEITLKNASLVVTYEIWRCIRKQGIKEDATDLIQHGDEQFIRRNELYIAFRAQEVNGLPGSYILRLGIKHRDPLIHGYLFIDQARLIERNKSYLFELKAKAIGQIEAGLLYGRQPQLKTSLFSCPEAELFEPYTVTFLKTHEIKQSLKIESKVINEEWDEIHIVIDPSLLKEAKFIDECEELLDTLDKEFSSSQDFVFLWDKSKVMSNLEDIILSTEQRTKLKYHILMKITYKNTREEITRNGTSFIPQLRQNISVKEPNGKVVGGEIRIGVEQLADK